MRRQKYFFDFKIEISVKFRVEWCIWPYDSLWICLRFPMISFLRRREVIQNIGKIGNLNINHMVIYIIRRGISRWFRFWYQKNIFAYAFKRKTRLKNAWANSKKFDCPEFEVKFWFEIYPYVTKSKIITPRIADVLKIEIYRLL